MTNKYKDLSEYEGHEVSLIRWIWNFEKLHVPPDRVRILKDYPRTVLFELEFRDGLWLTQQKPRRIRKMITKAAMAVKDVIVKDVVTGVKLTGEAVTEINRNEEELEIWKSLMML